ncbi:MAG: hypothetical protein WKG07_04620 [Hymenobacter sp.]
MVHLLRYLCHDDARFAEWQRCRASSAAARTADLQRLFEAELGQPLNYFQQWYRGEGFPAFNVRWNQVGSSLFLQVAKRPPCPPARLSSRLKLTIQLTFQDGTTRRVRLSQTQASQGFSVAVSGPVGTAPRRGPRRLAARPARLRAARPRAGAGRPPRRPPALALYPNPCREELLVSDLAVAATAEVYDATGRLVLRQALPPPGRQCVPRPWPPASTCCACAMSLVRCSAKGRFGRIKWV